MKKILKGLLVSIAILNIMGIILQYSIVKKYETKTEKRWIAYN
ncbi:MULTISPECIES: hypothetical protein [unclassified Clostridium]|nr:MULTISPECIES: hypothetical protein [unclassified Clostridium]EKQ51317.1 MAG: hypothetical protein A370_04927 [Clostridium sp. Maddingley MBC34-26]